MRNEPPDITDYLTDGSLAKLCASMHRITGVPLAVRDVKGEVVVGEAPSGSDRDEFTAPLHVLTGPIGALVIPEHTTSEHPTTDEIRRFITLLASVVSELCDRDEEVHERLDELGALHKLSTMLVGVTDIDRILSAGIEMAVDVLGVDAGAIRLLTKDGRRLTLAASFGLSSEYAERTRELESDIVSDTKALAGGLVLFENIIRDGNPSHPAAMDSEGLRSMVSAGLNFHGEIMGVVRLFTRTERTFSATEQRLILSIAQQLAAALASARLVESEAESAEINRQVRMASAVQRRMMPENRVEHAGLDIAARYQSSYDLGGDFFDVFDTADQGLAFVVGDVVGKGVAAAMLMSSLRATIRTLVDTGFTISETIDRANTALSRDTRSHEFATVFAGIIAPDARSIRYVSAGHEPTLLIRATPNAAPTEEDIIELRTGGMLIGVDVGQEYETGELSLRPGDTLLAYTDGLTEAMNFEEELYGRRRIREAILATLRETPDASAEHLADKTLWAMRCHTGMQPQSDDVTLVVVRVLG